MKLVLDDSVATKWYLPVQDSAKAMSLRLELHRGVHELLVPDTLPAHCVTTFMAAERKGSILPGETKLNLNDLLTFGLTFHSAFPLLRRATEIALATRLSIDASVCVALAEQEQCQLMTADQRVIRNTRRHFYFIIPLSSLP